MGFFKKADISKTDKYFTDDNQDWIEFRGEISKAEANIILEHAPTVERDIKGNLDFLEFFFQRVIVGWSAVDDENSPLLPTVDNYRTLAAPAARWVDDKLQQQFQKLLGIEVAELEGKSS